jgi:hypothetical protein
VFQLLRNWLLDSKNGRWLLILDNVDDARYLVEPPSGSGHQTGNNQQSPPHERILDYLPASGQGSILLTSRTTEAAFKVVERSSVIVIEPMGAQHAVELLRRKLDCGYTHEEALQLAEALDFMPLAISQAAAYIGQESPRCSVQQYLKTLLESDKSDQVCSISTMETFGVTKKRPTPSSQLGRSLSTIFAPFGPRLPTYFLSCVSSTDSLSQSRF